MKKLRRNKGFTLIELLIVVAILGVLAAVVIPNVGRFLGKGDTEARNSELKNIQSATTAAMTDTNTTVLVPATATKDMNLFPDTTSAIGVASVAVGSVAELRLWDHDSDQSDATNGPQVKYVTTQTTKCSYLAQADGTVTWADSAGVATSLVASADCT